LVDISDKIHSSFVDGIDAIRRVAQAQDIPFFIVGATARDLMLHHAFGVPVRRATLDIDIAIRVSDWQQYDSLAASLLASTMFTRVGRGHRFLFRGSEPIDIVPFGRIAGTAKKVAWPPDESFILGVVGFEEAYRSAILVTLRQGPRLDVRVATPAGLAIMKLVSWDEAYPARAKDAEDFYLIAVSYVDLGNQERVYEDASGFTRGEDFDRQMAGARLLGRDMRGLANDDTFRILDEILRRESDQNGEWKLLTDIVGSNITRSEEETSILARIESVRMGLMDRRRQDNR
jgi:predicted nucleotidyltransferase